MLVHRKVLDAYLEHLNLLFSQVKLGDPMDKRTFQGYCSNQMWVKAVLTLSSPQVDVNQALRIMDLIDCGKSDGTLVSGGQRHSGTVRMFDG